MHLDAASKQEEKRNKFLWSALSKSFGEKCKHTELALNFIQKQYFS